MQAIKITITLCVSLLVFGCGQNREDMKNKTMEENSPVANAFISSSAAKENKKDTARKFIRTADLKFKVKSVIKSTYDIENITQKQGGFVTFTNLNSTINYVTNTAVSEDSVLEVTYYTVENSMIVRVPNTALDTTLKEISRNIDYLDYRIIKADDVALEILSNTLTQKRSQKNEDRLTAAIDQKGQKLKETVLAEDLVLRKQQQSDEAKISNLSLTDQINFSTIHVSMYQRQEVKKELISNHKNIEEYKPNFGRKLLGSVKYGWIILEAFLVFLAKLWGLFLFAILVFVLYKAYKLRWKSRNK